MSDDGPMDAEVVPLTPQPDDSGAEDQVSNPAELIRIGTMVQALRDEVRDVTLDEPGRARLSEIHKRAIDAVKNLLSTDLQRELDQFALPLGDGVPTASELRVAQAQLVGWLDGLFRGIQAAVFSQQANAQRQLQELNRRQQPGGQYL